MQALFAIQRGHAGISKFKKKAGLSTQKATEDTNFERLPHHVHPLNYTMCIKPNLNSFAYEGCVSIHCEIKREAKVICLHAIELNISKIMWEEDVTENRQEPFEYFIDGAREQLRIVFEPPLLPSKGNIRVNFNSHMNKKTFGFYHSKYISANGEELASGVTKFETAEARRCFPCWDEPYWKATFDLSFILPRTLTALSNMPIKVTYPHRTKKELHVVEFLRTPMISPYLTAFVFGEFDFIETKVGQTTVRVYTPLGMAEKYSFALETAAKMLAHFERVFEIPYPLTKLDLVGVTDLNTSAIGHWGLIIFRATRFVSIEGETSGSTKQIIARTIAHYIAQQWLGSAVTVDWWSHQWTFESYLTFMEYVSVDALFPEFDIWTNFLSEVYSRGLELDGLTSTHPIDNIIYHPSELRDAFDLVILFKSTAIIRMLNRYIGDSNLLEGINQFLTKYLHRNAGAEQLWKILDEISSKPVSHFMHTWTRQLGFPLVRMTSCKYDPNQKTIVMTITQEKFWVDTALRENRVLNKEFHWAIPISLSSASSPTKSVRDMLMEKKNVTITLSNIPKAQWVKLNPGQFGYFRVKYTTEILGLFLPAIRNRTMPAIDRFGILSDLLALAQCGLSSAVEIFSLLEAFVDEDNYMVWMEIDKVMESLDLLLFGSDCYERLHIFCRAILANVFERVTWDKQEHEKPSISKLRALVLNRLIRMGHDKVMEEGIKRAEALMNGTKEVPAELRGVLFRIALKMGTGETQRNFFKMYRDTDNLEEKERIAQALGEVADVDHLQDALTFAISDDVKMHDSLAIFKAVGMRKPGIDVAWEFLKEHWIFLRNKYPAGPLSSELIHSTTSNFIAEEKAVEVGDFFRDHPFAGTERAIQQSLERIRMMDTWLKKDVLLLTDYLASY